MFFALWTNENLTELWSLWDKKRLNEAEFKGIPLYSFAIISFLTAFIFQPWYLKLRFFSKDLENAEVHEHELEINKLVFTSETLNKRLFRERDAERPSNLDFKNVPVAQIDEEQNFNTMPSAFTEN